jgi:hypothetical protein
LARKQSRALTAIFDAQKESANVELSLDEREAEILSEAQMGRLWARQRQDWVREVRDESKAAYLAAELEYAEAQRERVKEIHDKVFAATSDADLDTLQKLLTVGEDVLDQMLTMALEASNEVAARRILHAAHVRDDGERILIRWEREVEGGEEDLEMLAELHEALDDEQLERRMDEDLFERVAPDEPTWESMLPRPGAVGW